MNFTRKSRQSTVKHEVKSKFRWFASNFCRKNTGFLVDFHFFDDKKTKKHVYFTVSTRPKRRKHDKTHGFESKKSQIREEFVESPAGATTFAANPGETSVKCACKPPRGSRTQKFYRLKHTLASYVTVDNSS
jgi:hypothetical protein